MLCAISGEAPEEPVVSKKTGTVFEKRLIEKYIEENGKDPITSDELDLDDLLPIKSARVVRPRPPTLTSIPALLSTFQNEWDALALETFKLKQQLSQTRDELANALYQHDAAVRVIARLTKERDEARAALSNVTVTGGAGASANGEAMAVDNEALPEDLAQHVDDTQAKLSKSRKKRPVPGGWAKANEIASFAPQLSESLPVPQASSIGTEAGYAAVGGLKGDAAVFSIAAGQVERSLQVNEPITDTLWHGSKVIFATSKGSVKVLEGGSEVASFAEHAGAATALSLHPGGTILASVGTDKSFVFYDMDALKRVTRVYTNTPLTACAFHPDGHLFAAGTNAGAIKMYLTKTGEEAATFSLGAPVEALVFSENGYWIAATAKGQTTVTVFDLRKEGDAATAKVLDIGSAVQSLAWDYTGQFLATAGPSGVTVQQYAKSSKKWSEALQSATPAVAVAWGEEAKKLVTVNRDGVISVLAAPDE
ncbi:Prp19-domain-containing protein [Cryphonectria parasitica EP155]|uniref:Pre-mRNA-processing factor 19 n=1 Tax=Cryphonectria parasitica (strain ATCC 38755 / EP155) TaxID=660469 RepID=A0A9P5CNK6_CRYP1|nr:Prp19-domain-containing protein [Cryphonectria parasitica EP155]KAF3765243.1 Prp19-domain-containing protein [Cryphonectria parasitica EP155]